MVAVPAPVRRACGFTLLELLVVLALTGLLGSAVLLTMPTPRSAVTRDADALAAQLQRAQQEAIVTGRSVRVQLDASGYRFVQQSLDGWTAMHEVPFRPRQWHADVTLLLPRSDAVQWLRFDPVGQAEPAQLTLQGDGRRADIDIAMGGHIEVRHDAR